LTDVQFHEYTRRKFEPIEETISGAAAALAAKPALTPEKVEGVVSARQILGPKLLAAKQATVEAVVQRKAELTRDLAAGRLAVRLGKVPAHEALHRLRGRYPDEAHDLVAADLLS
ncbi:MAG: hypothetical protein WCJ30_29115, partial [Deltaproteobacteria bacterium]